MSLRRIVGFVNVAFFWCVMLHLMYSLLSIVWASCTAILFGEHAYDFIDDDIATHLLLYIALIIAASSSLWLWAQYNRLRFGGRRDKRTVHPPALTQEQLRDYTGFSFAKLLKMRYAKMLVARFDGKRELEDMDCYAEIPALVEADKYVFGPASMQSPLLSDSPEFVEAEEVANVEVAYCIAHRRRKTFVFDVDAVLVS